MGSEAFHEPPELLSEDTKNMHRALVSLREELEAVDWYRQRAEACSDEDLRAVLIHNKREEIEHAMMVLEWIRRHSATFAKNVATYLGTSEPITQIEGKPIGETGRSRAGEASGAGSPSLGIGSLKAGT
jgi:ferritin-like protein